MSDTVPDVDWTRFDGLAESTLTCQCGFRFRSHAKLVAVDAYPGFIAVARKACPACARRTNPRHIESDPEVFSI
jgi:hypothetical protein